MKTLIAIYVLAISLLPLFSYGQTLDFTYNASATSCGEVTLIVERTGTVGISQWFYGIDSRIIANKGGLKDTIFFNHMPIGWAPFTITAIGSNGMNKIAVDSVYIVGLPAFNTKATSLIMCKGDTSTIDLSKGLLVSGQTKWLDNFSTSLQRTFIDTVDTKYLVQGTRGTCTQTLTVNVDVIDLRPSFRVQSTSGAGPISVSFWNHSDEDAAQFLWEFGATGITNSTIANPTALYQKPGNYKVTLHTQNRDGTCKDSISQNIGVWPTSIEPADILQTSIYPNPTKDRLTIENTLGETLKMVLYSTSGQVMTEQVINQTTTNLDLSSYEAGVYLLNVQSETEQYTIRVTRLND